MLRWVIKSAAQWVWVTLRDFYVDVPRFVREEWRQRGRRISPMGGSRSE